MFTGAQKSATSTAQKSTASDIEDYCMYSCFCLLADTFHYLLPAFNEANLYKSTLSVEEKVAIASSVGEVLLRNAIINQSFNNRNFNSLCNVGSHLSWGINCSLQSQRASNRLRWFRTFWKNAYSAGILIFQVYNDSNNYYWPQIKGVMRAINVNKLTSTGCLFKFWVADWFAQLNNKAILLTLPSLFSIKINLPFIFCECRWTETWRRSA